MERISKVFYPYEPKYIEEDRKHLEGEEEVEAAVAAAAKRQIQDEELSWLKLEWTGAADAALFGYRNWNSVPALSPNFDNANFFSKKLLYLLRRGRYVEHHGLALHLLWTDRLKTYFRMVKVNWYHSPELVAVCLPAEFPQPECWPARVLVPAPARNQWVLKGSNALVRVGFFSLFLPFFGQKTHLKQWHRKNLPPSSSSFVPQVAISPIDMNIHALLAMSTLLLLGEHSDMHLHAT